MANDMEVEIARLDERLKAHAEATTKQFGLQNIAIGEITAKLDTLTATMNQGKGVYAASMTLAGVIGAGIMAAIEWAKH